MKTLYPYTSAMPVSAKFYARICERVNSVVSTLMVPNADRRRDKVLRLIHDYLTDPGASAALLAEYKDNVCTVIFLTLRAELDAAIERSRRARARAAGRRALEQTEEKTDAAPLADNSSLSDRPAEPVRDDSAATSVSQIKGRPNNSHLHNKPRSRYGLNFRPIRRPTRKPHPYPRKTIPVRR